MVPYAAAGPDLAMVTPKVMVLLVTPGSVAVVPPEPPQAVSATTNAARAANRGPIRAMKAPPIADKADIKQSEDPGASVQSLVRPPRAGAYAKPGNRRLSAR